jgi:sugar/nucleoside kinase (ribokinase family)
MEDSQRLSAVVAGHICLDIIPNLSHLRAGQFVEQFQPGRLITAGSATLGTGGPVSNTGLALHRLGVSTRLIARVGADPFGGIIRSMVSRDDPRLAQGIVSDADTSTSYTVVISAPGMDRFFLHCPGANDRFGVEDINLDIVHSAALFHFGYPPIMRRMYIAGGRELVEVMRCVQAAGATTSLDMTFPDPSIEGGRVDWRTILYAVLPYVDIFLPSIEELLFMLRREVFEQMWQAGGGQGFLESVTPELLSDLSGELLSLGVKMAGIKVGERGFYLHTATAGRLADMGRAAPSDLLSWADQELWAPCFRANLVGTTGAGDATIAGFFAALLRNLPPYQAVIAGVAVGACNVEAADALSGICSWDATLARLRAGWQQHEMVLDSPGWRRGEMGVWEKKR